MSQTCLASGPTHKFADALINGPRHPLLIVLNDARQPVLDFSYLTIAQGDDQIGLREDLEVVGDGDEAALIAVAAQQGHHLQAGPPVQQSRGLVGKDDARAVDHRPRHGHPLPLAAGKLVGEAMQLVTHTQIGQ